MKQKLLLFFIGLFITSFNYAQVANQPSDLELCDDELNDGIAVFNLAVLDAGILGNQDPSNFILTYYQSQSDAENGVSPVPLIYTNITNPQTMFVRLEEAVSGNYDTTSFNLFVKPSPSFSIDDISICDGSSYVVDTGLDPALHTFMWSTGESTPTITASVEGLYWVAVQNLEGCFLEKAFNVTLDGALSFNQPNPLYNCDLNGNGFAEFDLEQATPDIVGSQTDLEVTYYATQAEAEGGITSLVTEFPYINVVPYNQVLYFRVESIQGGCFAIGSLELVVSNVSPIPSISDFVVCDEDQDGFAEFMLQSKIDEVLANQPNFNLEVSFHLSQSDALNLMNPLSDPFINTTNPQTVYVAVTDVNGCGTEIQSFTLLADQTCLPCQTIEPSIDSTTPEPNISGIVIAQSNEDINFTGSATFSGDASDAVYIWSFGDNSEALGTSVNHSYAQEGSYTVTLTVTDSSPEACSESTTIMVEILGQSISVDQTQFTVEELVQNVLIGNDCSQISNISYSTGSSFDGFEPNGIGYFTYGGNDFPFSEGLLLSTGNAAEAEGPNDGVIASDGSNIWPGDTDLDSELGINSNNATSIEFDFVPVVNQINFDFLMASEEYDGAGFECSFSDAFAFLLTDAMGNTTNLALIPGTDLPITVTNIHNASDSCPEANSQYFGGYTADNSPLMRYNGRTVSFSAQAQVNIGETYHIKLVVADDVDSIYDTAVFLKAGSFDIGGICEDIGLISLRAFNDVNTNGDFDTGESNFTNGSFTYEKNNDGVINVVNSSSGSFTIVSTDENDTYDISFSVNDDYTDCYTQNVTTFSNVSVLFGELAQVDFPIEDNLVCEDLAVYLINPFASPRPGFEHLNTLIIENLSGANIATGSVEFVLDDDLIINNTLLSNTNMSITTTATGFTLYFTDLGAGETENVEITLLCPTTLALGEMVTNTVSYTTSSNDTVAENNLASLSEVVIGSYDPNDKMESHGPNIVYNDFISSDEYLYYTIRFQNVGTAEAIFIRIEDELDSQLDETTFQMLRSSHDYMVTRTGSSLEWFFDDINLPAEQDDAAGSNGFVHFKIKPKSGYTLGDVIPNTASIFFDFNAPIITNTFTTTFVETLSVNDFEATGFIMYPNPARDLVTIKFNDNLVHNINLVVYDIQGKTVNIPMNYGSYAVELNTSSLQTGLYFVQLAGKSMSETQKLIIN
ncbi:DUF7619 domain-containing protein [Winogradskyella flava]|uniref:Choice-of-anchor L domain-containing protein n=1 Tax=Winogradskyella flava TaxID=1884876 RepID=A0A842IWJ5_9FLAO|nr:choice-of-anchor L domain-containing protein [Winogradskyella flava]MBC2845687.1 choice-of-anchor L domain-containing protein [Winogradskyella flava]